MHKSVPLAEKRPQKPDTGIKGGFQEMEHNFRLEYPSGETGLPFPMFLCSRKFSLETTQEKLCSIYFPTDFFGNVL